MSLTHQVTALGTGQLVDMLAAGKLVPAGPTGGPAWSRQRQALLFASLESGWPIGHLLAWNPSSRPAASRWFLLDGHRRAATLTALSAPDDRGLLRDVTTEEPTYLPADQTIDGGEYLPVAAMLSTMRFLAATQHLTRANLARAEAFASRIIRARIEVVALLGGTPAEVATLCQRLIPGRLDPRVLDTIAAQYNDGRTRPGAGA